MSTSGGGRSRCAAGAAGRGWSGSGTRPPGPWTATSVPGPGTGRPQAAAVAGGEQPGADDGERDLPDDRPPLMPLTESPQGRSWKFPAWLTLSLLRLVTGCHGPCRRVAVAL